MFEDEFKFLQLVLEIERRGVRIFTDIWILEFKFKD